MITSYATLIPATATKVFVSSTTGASIGGAVTGQVNAITTIALCNTGAPTLTDETINSVTVNIYFVKSGFTYAPYNLVVNRLIIPAGETVFFSEERIVLDGGDEIWVNPSVADLLAVTVSTLPV